MALDLKNIQSIILAILHSPQFAKYGAAVMDLSDGDIDDPRTADVIREAEAKAVSMLTVVIQQTKNPWIWWLYSAYYKTQIETAASLAVEKWIAELIAKAKTQPA